MRVSHRPFRAVLTARYALGGADNGRVSMDHFRRKRLKGSFDEGTGEGLYEGGGDGRSEQAAGHRHGS